MSSSNQKQSARFEKVAIYGLGLIGGSFASALKRKRPELRIVGIDRAPVNKKAIEQGLVDCAFLPDQLRQALRDAEALVLATPIQSIKGILREISNVIRPGTVITDVGSTKCHIMQEARKCLPKDVFFVGGHPMTGSEKNGIEHADPFLFENAIYVLTRDDKVPEEVLLKLGDLVECIGAKCIFLSAGEHDEIAATVSHLPQMLALALVQYTGRKNTGNEAFLKLAAGGFRDMTRIASCSYEVWQDILATNQSNIETAIDDFISELQNLKGMLGTTSMSEVFSESARIRLSIPKNTRGFLRPHFDLYIVIEDRPGMIHAIASRLYQEGINIKDIEVVKVREGDGGTLRLAFETESDRLKAAGVLERDNFTTKIRS